MPHPWKCWRAGWMAFCTCGRCPCPWWRDWNWMIFTVPLYDSIIPLFSWKSSNLMSHLMILCDCFMIWPPKCSNPLLAFIVCFFRQKMVAHFTSWGTLCVHGHEKPSSYSWLFLAPTAEIVKTASVYFEMHSPFIHWKYKIILTIRRFWDFFCKQLLNRW